jgi:hypothetical protein
MKFMKEKYLLVALTFLSICSWAREENALELKLPETASVGPSEGSNGDFRISTNAISAAVGSPRVDLSLRLLPSFAVGVGAGADFLSSVFEFAETQRYQWNLSLIFSPTGSIHKTGFYLESYAGQFTGSVVDPDGFLKDKGTSYYNQRGRFIGFVVGFEKKYESGFAFHLGGGYRYTWGESKVSPGTTETGNMEAPQTTGPRPVLDGSVGWIF